MANFYQTVILFACALLMAGIRAVSAGTLEDLHESCEFWASIGECDKNPGYMKPNCALSCSGLPTGEDLPAMPASFYDIQEVDLYGKQFSFSKLKGRVVYIVNVASKCGYTEANYKQFNELKKYTSRGLQIVLAPCNSFGFQEPGDTVEIEAFAKAKGFSGLILSKGEVNGDNTRPSFRYLKAQTDKSYINWNFEGKFVVDRQGNVYAARDDLENQIQELLDAPEL